MTSTSPSGGRSTADQRKAGQQAEAQRNSDQRARAEGGKQVHHGRTPASWAGSLTALVAFIVGGIGFVLPPHPNWVVVAIAGVILLAGLIATVVLRKLGYGAD